MIHRQVDPLGIGSHEYVLGDVSRLAPGLYLVRLRQGGRSEIRRIAIVH